MSGNPFTETPAAWELCFDGYDPADEGRRETILALGNGMFVTRAAATDAGRDDAHYPGTYRAGCYNRLSGTIAGHCDQTESLVNLPNWLPLACRRPGQPWMRLDCMQVLRHTHCIDMRKGTSCREYLLQDEDGRQTCFRETRLVSMDDPHLAALRVEVTPLNWCGELEFRSAIDGDVANTNVKRYADYPGRHLESFVCGALAEDGVFLLARTSQSHIVIALAMRTSTDAKIVSIETLQEKRAIGQLFRVVLEQGRTAAIDKRIALHTSVDADGHDARDAAGRSIAACAPFAAMQTRHAQAWQRLWRQTGIEITDQKLAMPLRLHAFHLLQTVSPHVAALDAGIPARGWHGEGYHGHIFWDELFVFPFLIFRFPATAKACLMYRYRRLDAARDAARQAGYRGAMYPWRSASDGREVTPEHQKNLISGGWMEDHTYLQRHVGAAIVFNIWHYYLATGDTAFLHDHGAEMMLDIARFWSSIAVQGKEKERFEIRGVIGPDEYHNAYPWRDRPGLDNNAYTNVMAAWTLCRALELREHLPSARWHALLHQLQIDDAELARWNLLSRRMFVPFHDGIINQYEGFEKLEEFDPAILPASMKNKRVDWALQAIGRNADQFKITKQADALTLFYLFRKEEIAALFARLGYPCADDCILRTARYYLARTVHRSSLSRVVYAGALAQVAPDMSWDFYRHVVETDLDPLKGESVAEGVHLGAMGASIDILQRRYLGIHACEDGLALDPCLPPQLGQVRLTLHCRGERISVDHADGELRLSAAAENRKPLTIRFRDARLTLAPGETISLGEALAVAAE